MFREMRRKKQALSREESQAILFRGLSGVLALAGDDDYPYALPISYVYDGGKLYFHCAKTGHKLDAIARNSKASFCVIDQDHIVPEEYTTYFRSAIAFGRIQIMEDGPAKVAAAQKLAAKYAPDIAEEARQGAIDREWKALCMLEMTIDHLSGKEARELAQGKRPEQ